MQIRADRLPHELDKGLAPIYLLSGDEPLQLGEAADAIRSAARKAGFGQREVLEASAGFDWNSLRHALDSPSLFGDRRLLELRLHSSGPGRDGASILQAIGEQPQDDTIVLISMGKLPASTRKSRWFQSIDHHGIIVQVWPLHGEQLLRWLDQRLRSKGMKPDKTGVRLLAGRVEGNLLAAAQEIEKLFIQQGAGPVSADVIAESVADSARFDVFDLVDNALQGHLVSTERCLRAIRAEGIAPAVVLWALSRELRSLERIAFSTRSGTALDSALRQAGVWDKRKSLIAKALKRLTLDDICRLLLECATIDRIIKGLHPGEPWAMLGRVSHQVAGVRPLRCDPDRRRDLTTD